MILVTGAGGFVGKAVVSELARRGISYRAVTRRPHDGYLGIGNIDPATDWTHALEGRGNGRSPRFARPCLE